MAVLAPSNIRCAGYMGHPFKKRLSDNDYYGFQVPFLRTDVPCSQQVPHPTRGCRRGGKPDNQVGCEV
jgi:hypothetical protein